MRIMIVARQCDDNGYAIEASGAAFRDSIFELGSIDTTLPSDVSSAGNANVSFILLSATLSATLFNCGRSGGRVVAPGGYHLTGSLNRDVGFLGCVVDSTNVSITGAALAAFSNWRSASFILEGA
jgi:hypothetical protein